MLGSTVHMFCHANVSHYSWKVIHLDFKNSSLSRRLISVFSNETNKLLGDTINARVISDNAIVNISYILNITEEAMVCFMDGEYICDIELTDDTIHTKNDKGTLSVTGIHKPIVYFKQYFIYFQKILTFIKNLHTLEENIGQ